MSPHFSRKRRGDIPKLTSGVHIAPDPRRPEGKEASMIGSMADDSPPTCQSGRMCNPICWTR